MTRNVHRAYLPSVALTLTLSLLLACQTAAQSTPPTSAPPVATPTTAATASSAPLEITVRDDLGRTVKLARAPKRIVSLAPSNTELVYALGLESRLVGVDDFSDFPAAAKEKTKVGSFFQPSLEKIIELSPDLVLATSLHEKKLLPELEKQAIPTVVFQPKDLPGVIENVLTLGKLGETARSQELGAAYEKRLKAVSESVAKTTSRPKVFFELSPDLYTVAPGSFIHDLLARAGCSNIVTDASNPFPQLSNEALVAANPEVILIGDAAAGVTADAVRARAGWAGVDAVKKGKVAVIDADLTTRPGPRAFDGLELIFRVVHTGATG